MGLFTEKFLATKMDDRPKLVDDERAKRSVTDPDDYTAIPIVVPKMSSIAVGQVAEYELFWLVGMPGPVSHPKDPSRFARECLNFPVSREASALDLVFLLNGARQARTDIPDDPNPATPGEETHVDDLVGAMVEGAPGIPEVATLTATDEADTGN